MGIAKFITSARNRYTSDLAGDPRYWSLSADTYLYHSKISEIVRRYTRGRTLDAGAGRLNGKMVLEKYLDSYVSMDVSDADGNVDIVGDIQDMKTIDDCSFDTVYSSQVLEHVPSPCRALSEIYRVLVPGGCAIVSVPHLNGLHEEPHDYYRYTPYGLRHLMQQAGFVVEEEATSGGLCAFLLHPFSLVLVCSFWSIPGVRWLVWWLNKIFLLHLLAKVDDMLGLERKFPSVVIVVGRKAAVGEV